MKDGFRFLGVICAVCDLAATELCYPQPRSCYSENFKLKHTLIHKKLMYVVGSMGKLQVSEILVLLQN